MKKKQKEAEVQNIVMVKETELVAIKKLLMLLLLKAGASQDEIGAALEIDRSNVSRMFKGIKIKKFRKED